MNRQIAGAKPVPWPCLGEESRRQVAPPETFRAKGIEGFYEP
jgi:hypothetical protein